jgi:hypothetical protein
MGYRCFYANGTGGKSKFFGNGQFQLPFYRRTTHPSCITDAQLSSRAMTGYLRRVNEAGERGEVCRLLR